MLAFSRELDVQYRTASVLAHKMREAMASGMKGLQIGGEGRVAEIDGAYFGGHVRPENRAADRIDRRRAENRSGKRRVVVVMRERHGRTLAQVFGGEDAAGPTIRQRIAQGTVVHADESPAWNPPHVRFAMQRGHSFGRVEANALKVYADSPSGSDVDNQTLAQDAAGPSTPTIKGGFWCGGCLAVARAGFP